MRIFVTIILIFTSLTFCCKSKDKPSPKKEIANDERLQSIVNSIAKENVIGDNIGIAGSPYRFEQFQELNKTATNEQLLALTEHHNPSIRYYSFRALAKRQNPNVVDILFKHIHDTAQLTSFHGCIGMEETVVYNFINILTSKYIEPGGYKLNKTQAKILDSLLRIYPDPVYGKMRPDD